MQRYSWSLRENAKYFVTLVLKTVIHESELLDFHPENSGRKPCLAGRQARL